MEAALKGTLLLRDPGVSPLPAPPRKSFGEFNEGERFCRIPKPGTDQFKRSLVKKVDGSFTAYAEYEPQTKFVIPDDEIVEVCDSSERGRGNYNVGQVAVRKRMVV